MTEGVTELEKLEVKIAATVSFHFGSICDRIDTSFSGINSLTERLVECIRTTTCALDAPALERLRLRVHDMLTEHFSNATAALKKETRNHGNDAIRIINNHLRHVRILRRVKKSDKLNTERIARTNERSN